MPKFAYVAEGPDGTELRGVQTADSIGAARTALAQQRLRVRSVAEKRSVLQLELSPSRIKRGELMHLSRQLSAFLRAGVPILDAIRMLGEESKSRAVQRVMAELEADLRSGARLSDAINGHPGDFPAFYRGIIKSAELTGRLDEVLLQLAFYIERDVEARKKVKSAVTYPLIVMVMSLVTVVVLAVYVLPKFKDFFASLDAKLPAPTRALLALTDFVSAFWWLVVSVPVLLLVLLVLTRRIESVKHLMQQVTLSVPVLGETIQFMLVERYCRIMSSMVSAGVPLTEALTVARQGLNNLVYDRKLEVAYAGMLAGGGLARPLQESKLFPGIAGQMFKVGEETGSLDAQLEVAAEYFERELDYKIKRLTSYFEPAVIIVAGAVVGFVAIALVSAMYGIFRQVHVS